MPLSAADYRPRHAEHAVLYRVIAEQLVQERPGCLVGDPELALQLERRQARRVSGHQAGGPEPHRQWQPRSVQNRARRQGGLSSAGLALPKPPSRQLDAHRRHVG